MQLSQTGSQVHHGLNDRRERDRLRSLLLDEFGIGATPTIDSVFIRHYQRIKNSHKSFDSQQAELRSIISEELRRPELPNLTLGRSTSPASV